MRPKIGITTSYEEGTQKVARAYIRAVEWAGGLPIIVPVVDRQETLRSILSELSAVVITGGPAVTDGMLGKLPDDIGEADPTRTNSDRAILQAFLRSERPVLGICYGMQLINASFGGTIYADVQRQHQGSLVHSEKRGGSEHAVQFEPGSWLEKLIGTRARRVNTRHIQAVADPGHSVAVTCRAEDGVIEGIETDDGRIIGVQFHPELMDDAALPLFSHLVDYARSHALV